MLLQQHTRRWAVDATLCPPIIIIIIICYRIISLSLIFRIMLQYYHQRHHYNYHHHHQHQDFVKSGSSPDSRDEDKENIKQKDSECLQQQLDEVLRACVDYEELHKSRQQMTENTGNTSPGSPLPQQNRYRILLGILILLYRYITKYIIIYII